MFRPQELCGSRGGRPRLPSLISLRFLSAYLFIMTKQHFVTIIAFFYVSESCFRMLAVLVSAAIRLDFLFVFGGLASPWYNHTGWLGIKRQFIYLEDLPVRSFSVQCRFWDNTGVQWNSYRTDLLRENVPRDTFVLIPNPVRETWSEMYL